MPEKEIIYRMAIQLKARVHDVCLVMFVLKNFWSKNCICYQNCDLDHRCHLWNGGKEG